MNKFFAALAALFLVSPALALDSGSVPPRFPIPWAASAGSAYIRSIPTTSQIGIQNCAASLTDGFPPLTFTPAPSGGCPPFGGDFNGILKQLSQWAQWESAGGPNVYNGAFATAIGGYPKGSVLSGTTQGVYWLSIVENNTSNPDTGGAGWVSAYGNVQGPASSGSTNLAIFSGTSGKVLADSGVSIGDVGRLSQNQTFTGQKIFSGKTYFGSGVPWVDVKSGSNGCPAAVGNGAVPDESAIQCQLNFMYATYGGGIVFFPPGNYILNSRLTLQGGTRMMGSAQAVTSLTTTGDAGAVLITNCSSFPSIDNLFIVGFINGAAASSTVQVAANCPAIIRDTYIWGGAYALNTAGFDGYVENCFIWGAQTSILSTGANWYIRVKVDTIGQPYNTPYAFFQSNSAAAGVIENHFTQSDFSGSYTTSVGINDSGTSNAVTVFDGSVFSSGIIVFAARMTSLVGNEIGTVITSNSPIAMVGNLSFTPTTANGPGTRSCAGNINISC